MGRAEGCEGAELRIDVDLIQIGIERDLIDFEQCDLRCQALPRADPAG